MNAPLAKTESETENNEFHALAQGRIPARSQKERGIGQGHGGKSVTGRDFPLTPAFSPSTDASASGSTDLCSCPATRT